MQIPDNIYLDMPENIKLAIYICKLRFLFINSRLIKIKNSIKVKKLRKMKTISEY